MDSPHGAASARAANTPDAPPTELGLLQLVSPLLTRWRFVVGIPFASAVLAAAISLVLPKTFTAYSSFVPEGSASEIGLPGGLGGIAAQFGVAFPGGGRNSPQFYASVLRSRTVRDQVLTTRMADPRTEAAGDSATLLDILEVEGDAEPQRLEKGRRVLGGLVSVGVDPETDIVTVVVETPYAELSRDVANEHITLLNRFNFENRKAQAAETRQFVEERIRSAGADLTEAEEQLRRFLERNRTFGSSPELTFQHERLQRVVAIKQEVYTTLQRSYEEARMQYVNDTPVISVVDTAARPERRSSPKRTRIVILAAILGGLLAVAGAYGLSFIERARSRDDPAFREFLAQWAAVKADIRSAVRRSATPSA